MIGVELLRCTVCGAVAELLVDGRSRLATR
jgi:hypothetical protein